MLTYTSAPSHAQLLTTSEFGKKTELFDPPIEEFSVLRTHLETQGEKEAHRGIEGPSICIITEGSGELSGVKADRGDVLFVAPEFELEFTAGDKGMTVFRAYVEA
jgi:mannose-6-phosphate isomerase